MSDISPLDALRHQVFSQSIKKGKYTFCIKPESVESFETKKTEGLRATAIIVSGEHAGAEINLRFFSKGGLPGQAARDMRFVFKYGDIAKVGKNVNSLADLLRVSAAVLYPKNEQRPPSVAVTLMAGSDDRGLPEYAFMDDPTVVSDVLEQTVSPF